MHEKPHNLYSSPYITRIINSRIRWAGHIAHIGDGSNAYIVCGKTWRKENSWKPKHR